jgi:hypothetical protein
VEIGQRFDPQIGVGRRALCGITLLCFAELCWLLVGPVNHKHSPSYKQAFSSANKLF